MFYEYLIKPIFEYFAQKYYDKYHEPRKIKNDNRYKKLNKEISSLKNTIDLLENNDIQHVQADVKKISREMLKLSQEINSFKDMKH